MNVALPIVPARVWIDTKAAARLLGLSTNSFAQVRHRGQLQEAIDTKPDANHPSWCLYARDDLEHARRVMERCDVGLEIACRILVALDKDGPL